MSSWSPEIVRETNHHRYSSSTTATSTATERFGKRKDSSTTTLDDNNRGELLLQNFGDSRGGLLRRRGLTTSTATSTRRTTFGDEEEEEELVAALLDDQKMRDVRDVEHCLGGTIVGSIPEDARSIMSTTTAADDDILATAMNAAKIFVDDTDGIGGGGGIFHHPHMADQSATLMMQMMMKVDEGEEEDDDLNLDDRNRFLDQSWSMLKEFLDRSKPVCDTGNEECGGVKTKDQKKLAVLPPAKYPIYGFHPSRDPFVVVQCKLCGMSVKPVAHRAHMHSRHNIGLKSPEPTTPIASVISPSTFPSTSSSLSANPCSNAESIAHHHELVDDDCVLVVDPVGKGGLSKDVTKCVGPLATSTPGTNPTGDNYVVVAPHSDDRPLKLTIRRAKTAAAAAAAADHRSSPMLTQSRDRKKPQPPPPVAIAPPTILAASTGPVSTPIVKSRLRRPIVKLDGTTEQSPLVLQSTAAAAAAPAPNGGGEASWNHWTAPSTSSTTMTTPAAIESITLEIASSPIKVTASQPSPLSVVVSLPPPPQSIGLVTNLSSFQNHSYEHPRPLAISRFEQMPPMPSLQQCVQFNMPESESSSSKMNYGDHASYFVPSAPHHSFNNHRRWPNFRRQTQTFRQACHGIFVSNGGANGGDGIKNNEHQQEALTWRRITKKYTQQQQNINNNNNGLRERSKVIEVEVGNPQQRVATLNDCGTTASTMGVPKNRLLNNCDQQQHLQQTTMSPSSSHVAILRHPPAPPSHRMVRVANQLPPSATSSLLVSGEKFNNNNNNIIAAQSMSTTPINSTTTIPNNKTYTKVSINQLKAAAIESGGGNGQVPLDLGTLMCNGGSNDSSTTTVTNSAPSTPTNFQYKAVTSSYINGPSKATAAMMGQKRTPMKRSSSSIIGPMLGQLGGASESHHVMGTMGGGVKKARMHQQFVRTNGRAIVEVEELSNSGMGHPHMGMKTSLSTSMNQVHARQQLAKALQHAHHPNGAVAGNRNRNKAQGGIRHQLTPIVISPSQTPQAVSPHPQQQQQSAAPQQQQQVVLVSVNGPAVLSGWHKLTTNAMGEAQIQQHHQPTTATIITQQNGLTTTTTSNATIVDNMNTGGGTRIIRPKLTPAPGPTSSATTTGVPIYMAHPDQIQLHHQSNQSYHHHHRQNMLAQKMATTGGGGGGVMNGGSNVHHHGGGFYTSKHYAQQNRFSRQQQQQVANNNSTMMTGGSAAMVLDDVSHHQHHHHYSIAQPQQQQQQQQFSHFRPIQPAQQIAYNNNNHHGGAMIRSTNVQSTSTPIGPIVLNVTTVPKGGLTVTSTPSSIATMGTLIGQQVSRQSSTPTSTTFGNTTTLS